MSEFGGTDQFARLRPLLFTLAYEILGSAADAEDVLQDSYLRWSAVDPATVEHPRAYLTRTVTWQALNHLRTTSRRREDYVGSWLPEPIRTEPDAGSDVLLAESVSMAMLLVLETLAPTERAVFVLSEVFGHSLVEIADMIGKSDATVRQIAHRARGHVRARRKRFHPDAATGQAVAGQFLRATRTGDTRALLELLAPDVVQISDGGGKVNAARHPIAGAERVAGFVLGLYRKYLADLDFDVATYNAQPAILTRAAGHLDNILLIEFDGTLITGLYAIRNPDKLAAYEIARPLGR